MYLNIELITKASTFCFPASLEFLHQDCLKILLYVLHEMLPKTIYMLFDSRLKLVSY